MQDHYLNESQNSEEGRVKRGKEVEWIGKRGQRWRESASHVAMAGFEEPRLDERKIWK
jgi:hypothetical protein